MFTLNFEQELHKQLLLISEERDRLLSRTEQMSLAINELEVLKEVSNNKASQLLLIFYKLQVISVNLSCFICVFYAANTGQS
jgi:hypothetical protein